MNTKHFAVLIMIAASLGALSSQTAFGQSIQITEELTLSTDQVLFVIGIGALAGAIKAWQGYDKSPNEFDLLRFVNGIRDNILVSIPIAFGAALALPELHAVGYVMIFFSVIGAASFAQKARETSIPSNATPDEIAKILEERK
jgi:hypothetical protein